MTMMKPVNRASPPVSRRQLLTGALGAAGAAALPGLAGCGSPASAGTRISYWNLLSGGDGITMTQLVDTVDELLKDVSIDQTVLEWGAPYYTKLAMASAGGRAPDTAIMHASRVTGYAPGGLLDPWDVDELAARGLTEDDFLPQVWDQGMVDGSLYSIALDTHPFIMLYNVDVAEKAGVLRGDGTLQPVDSPQEFRDMALQMQEVTGVHGLSWGYLGDGAQLWRLFYTMYLQQGAEMVLQTGKPAEVDLDAAMESLEFMISIVDGTIAARNGDIDTGIAEFANGDSGMLLTGVWEIPTMKDAGLNFDADIIPILYGTPAVYADSHTFVLPHQDNPDPQHREGVYDFVSELLKHSLPWAGAGHIPAFLPVVNSPEYDDLIPQAHYADAAELVHYDPPSWFTGSGSNFQDMFLDEIQGVLLGRISPEAGFEAFLDRVNTLLAKPNPLTV